MKQFWNSETGIAFWSKKDFLGQVKLNDHMGMVVVDQIKSLLLSVWIQLQPLPHA